MTTTLEVIRNYIDRSRECVSILRTHFRTDDLLRACVTGEIPRVGTLVDERMNYHFHGVGCRIESDQGCVDLDFGPNGIVGGFDSWRLFHFVLDSQRYDSEEFSRQRLNGDLHWLVETGQVIAPKLEPSPHLLYLADDSEV